MNVENIKTISDAIGVVKAYKDGYEAECITAEYYKKSEEKMREKYDRIDRERFDFMMECMRLRMDKMLLEQQLNRLGVPIIAGRKNEYPFKMSILKNGQLINP